MVKKKNAFTLIELIAVLVIMAILALIVTPLVMNIIRKARIAADKRSIDAYGRSIELAIAGYLLDTGKFPTDVNQLTIEYSGDEVICSTTQLNDDSSVYLTGCTVKGRTVDYAYGTDKTPQAPTYTAYSVGDEVSYNNVDYYVIKDSGLKESTVTLLKAEPISSIEISSLILSTVIQNKIDTNGTYAKMPYYSSENCVYYGETSGCVADYNLSDVKQLVDAWAGAKCPNVIESKLITYNELVNDLECSNNDCSNSTFNWIYSNDYWYWTMDKKNDTYSVWNLSNNGSIISSYVSNPNGNAVRPVIVLSKSDIPSDS